MIGLGSLPPPKLAGEAASPATVSTRVPATLERLGNTLAGGLPIALAEAVNGGRLREGSLVATVGYGGGLNAGGQLWRL